MTNGTFIANCIMQTNSQIIVNSYFYGLSTLAQVLAAIVGLFGIFTLFRIRQINDMLIGEGKALFIPFSEERAAKEKAEGKKPEREKIMHTLKNIKYRGVSEVFNRLNKGVARKDITDIGIHFKFLAKAWKNAPPEDETWIRDYNKYCSHIKKKNLIITSTIAAILFALITITYICIKIFYPPICCCLISKTYCSSLILSIICFILIFIIAWLSLRPLSSYTEDSEESFIEQPKKDQ